MFTDTEFMTAKEKSKVAKDWKQFLMSDFNEKYFTKSLYNHLHLHCNHIAHYDKAGFYDEWFSSDIQQVEFIMQFMTDVQSGRLSWGAGKDYADINTAMYEAINTSLPTQMTL